MMRPVFGVIGALLRRLDPETAHGLTIRALKRMPLILPPASDDPRLAVEVMGLKFPNPVGLAAGFDKNAEVADAMLSFGFGFVEAGTVTPLPQSGNPKPRLFRLTEDQAVINRLGFNNAGLAAAQHRQKHRRRRGIFGINVGANKESPDRVADYVRGLTELGPYADYVTVNISSPNTPGLRGLQNQKELEGLLAALDRARDATGLKVPLALKIAPDLDEEAQSAIARVACKSSLSALIVSNTTVARPSSLQSRWAAETGGLSGAPLFASSTAVLANMYRLTKGKLPLIGVGGIGSGADAYAKIKAGASLVQLYTALIYEGPQLVTRIKRDLAALLDRDGLKTVTDAVGLGAGRR